MRVAVEMLHVLIGIIAAAALTFAATWAYPLGRDVIWWCGCAAMVLIVLMGIGPLRRAYAQDRRDL